MAKWLVRMDLHQRRVGDPVLCSEQHEHTVFPGAPTIDEGVHSLLGDAEISLSGTQRRQIMRGARVVGFIEILDHYP